MPTEIERQHLATQPRFNAYGPCELCGFGPIAAAARTTSQIAIHKPDRVLLIGIAGTFNPSVLRVGVAALLPRVIMHGIGVGTDETFVPAGEMEFQQWPGQGEESPIGDELVLSTPLSSVSGSLLTCSAASASTKDMRHRLDRYPGVVAEDMEGYAVALACRLEHVPLVIVRGISNVVGDRLSKNWQIPQALSAAWSLAEEVIECASWDNRA